jgi:tetratricopeptide (TPR) repeat protein
VAINRDKVIAAAQKFVERGQYDKAIKEYLKITQEDPKDVRIWLKVGDLYAKADAKAEAIDTYQKVATFYSDQGFYLKAVAVYKQILKLDSQRIEIFLKLADLHRQLGLLSEAMQQLEQASNLLQRDGRTKEALEALSKIVELDPENVAGRIKLAELYSKEGFSKQAIEEFARATEALRQQNRVDDFIKVAERLVWHDPENVAVNKELAALYLKRDDPRRALPKLQACFKADPHDVETLLLLANAFEALDQTAKAVSVLKELARMHDDKGKSASRDDVWRRVAQLAPGDPEAKAALGGGREKDRPRDAAPAPSRGSSSRAEAPASSPPPPASTSSRLSVSARLPPPPPARGASRVEPPPSPPGRAAPVSAPVVESPERKVEKILAETDVYIKYGLLEKAVDHVQRVFEVAPSSLSARELLKNIYQKQGRLDGAADQLVILAEECFARGEKDVAARWLFECLELLPTHGRARELWAAHFAPVPRLSSEPPPVRHADVPASAVELEPELEGVELGDDVMELPDAERYGARVPRAPRERRPAAPQVEWTADVDDERAPTGQQQATRWGRRPERRRESLAPRPLEYSVNDFASSASLGGGSDVEDVDAAQALAGLPVGPSRGLQFGPGDFEQFEELRLDDEREGDSVTQRSQLLGVLPLDNEVGVPGAQLDIAESELAALEEKLYPAGDGGTIDQDLDEADFYVTQGLFEEALHVLNDLLSRYPDHPLVVAKLRDIEQSSAPARPSTAPRRAGSPQVSTTSRNDQTEPGSPPKRTGSVSAQRVVVAQGGDEDAETQYDLGIAYKEMGLIDDAMTQFRSAMRSSTKQIQCLLMLGLCSAEKNLLNDAIHFYKQGLYVEGISLPEELTLYYELGQSYERLGDAREAIYYYDKVLKRDPSFRDIDKRTQALRAKVPTPGTRGAAGVR